MKEAFFKIFSVVQYSGSYYLFMAGLLFVAVDRADMLESRRLYLAGIAVNRSLEDDRDNLLYYEYDAIKKPKDYAAQARLGICYFNLGDYRKAIHFYKQALRLKPEDEEVQRFLKLAETGKRGERPDPVRIWITHAQ
jgi:tetratricopeptide (TPR) repeat protein